MIWVSIIVLAASAGMAIACLHGMLRDFSPDAVQAAATVGILLALISIGAQMIGKVP